MLRSGTETNAGWKDSSIEGIEAQAALRDTISSKKTSVKLHVLLAEGALMRSSQHIAGVAQIQQLSVA